MIPKGRVKYYRPYLTAEEVHMLTKLTWESATNLGKIGGSKEADAAYNLWKKLRTVHLKIEEELLEASYTAAPAKPSLLESLGGADGDKYDPAVEAKKAKEIAKLLESDPSMAAFLGEEDEDSPDSPDSPDTNGEHNL